MVSRRRLTQILAGLVAVMAVLSTGAAQVPYIALYAGPTYDALGADKGKALIEIVGRPTFPTSGHLDLTTVGVQSDLTLVQAVYGWLDRDQRVVPRELYFPPETSETEIEQQNTQAMAQSQNSATSAALRSLGIPVTVRVRAVTAGAPAQGRLRAGDVVTSVDGIAVTDSGDLRTRVGAHKPGESVRIGYRRAGDVASTVIRTRAGSDPTRALIGVEPEDDYPFTVRISLAEVGGPSAGLMFALAIIDKLDAPALTGGAYIAGTGEIRADGTVGPIGGITQKLAGARSKGATVFLTPEANCDEAAANLPDGLRLVKVATLADAVRGLTALRDGGPPPAGCAA